MAAHHVISQPSTITGSIGVIFGKFDMTDLYQWLGVTIDQVKTSPNADIFSLLTSLTDEDELGGLPEAIAHMRRVLELEEDEELELVLYPQPQSLWEALSSGEFFGIQQRPSVNQWLEEQIPFLSRPAPWLLMPEARIY
jgi:ClpP class serine protease